MTSKRDTVKNLHVEASLAGINKSLYASRKKHGNHEYASAHETLGIITEEYFELIDAVKSGTKEDIISELEDIAVGCLWGIASLRQQMGLHLKKIDPITQDEGDIFTLKEFAVDVATGMLIDYDGHGYLMIGNDIIDRSMQITPSSFEKLDVIDPMYTHVMWYNR